MPAPSRVAPTFPKNKPKPSGGGEEGRPDGRVWIDLLNPGEAESQEAHAECGLRIPSREELSEVESSSRHFIENGAIYLSLPLLRRDSKDRPELTPVGFILTDAKLVTLRFAELNAFDSVREAMKAHPPVSGYDAFTQVIESIVDAEADALERLGDELEDVNRGVFAETDQRRSAKEMRAVLRRLGRSGEKLGKLRHSLATIARISAFVIDHGEGIDEALADRLNAARDDVDSLAHFQEALTNKSQFVLDAALGFINIDQNDIVRVLTVWTVVGVPPTLVASMYGMNFKNMPELSWTYGYPYALALIVVTTLLPLAWFRAKKWF